MVSFSDDNWTLFAHLFTICATPLRAIYLPSRLSRVRIPSPAPASFLFYLTFFSDINLKIDLHTHCRYKYISPV